MRRVFLVSLLIVAVSVPALAVEAFVTFKGTTAGVVDAFYRTQAEANAAATDNADIVAHIGAVEIGELAPNDSYFNGTAVVPDDVSETAELEARTVLRKLKDRCWATHEQLMEWSSALEKEGVAHPAAETNMGHSYLAYAHQWMYLVMNNVLKTGNTDFTLAEREKAAELLGMGASDVVSPFTFFRALHTQAGGLIAVPTGPVGWVDVSSGTRGPLHMAITTTGSLNLDTDKLPSTSIADGSWIDGITE